MRDGAYRHTVSTQDSYDIPYESLTLYKIRQLFTDDPFPFPTPPLRRRARI